MKKSIFFVFTLFILFSTSCTKDDDDNPVASSSFKVTITNVFEGKAHFDTGVFAIPVGATEAGPLFPNESYQFDIHAAVNHNLFFATMFVQTNDLFLSNDPQGGFPLYDANNNPISATYTVNVWDAGTEVNQAPGLGIDQAPRQSGPNVGQSEGGVVMSIDDVNDGFSYPTGDQLATIRVEHNSNSMFTVTIMNISGNSSVPGPLSPGAWIVTSATDNPFFTVGQTASLGLEGIAEDGSPTVMNSELEPISGYVSPFSPGAWAVHDSNTSALFEVGEEDRGEGLEGIAEDGDPTALGASLANDSDIIQSGVFTTPVGTSSPAPIFPGGSYEFTFTAEDGDYLNLATMLVQTNDLFFAFSEKGMALFNNGTPVSGDITSQLTLWDAGTEVNEYPGTDINQAPRQPSANVGADENGVVSTVNDAFTYPNTADAIQISIVPQGK